MRLGPSIRSLLAGLALPALIVAGCSGGGGGATDDGDGEVTIPVSLGPRAENVSMLANVANRVSVQRVDYDVLSLGGPFDSAKLDLLSGIGGVTIASVNGPGSKVQAVSSASLSVYIAPVEDEDPCATGLHYGPFAISLDAQYLPTDVTPGRQSAAPATVQVINSGAFQKCVVVMPPIAMTVTMSDVDVVATPCEAEPANIAGIWSGEYTCTSPPGLFCDPGGPTMLTVAQDGASATYEDDEASYRGTVCGDVFNFEGGANDGSYIESGQLTLLSATTARMTSNYRETGNVATPCSGMCTDTLTRQ